MGVQLSYGLGEAHFATTALLDLGEQVFNGRLLGQPCQLDRQVLLKRLTTSAGALLEDSMDLVGHVPH